MTQCPGNMTILDHHHTTSEIQNMSIGGFWTTAHTDHTGIPICFAQNFCTTYVCPTS